MKSRVLIKREKIRAWLRWIFEDVYDTFQSNWKRNEMFYYGSKAAVITRSEIQKLAGSI